MVYVTPDGQVVQTRPWSLGRVVDIFWGAVTFVTGFFQTLFGFENTSNSSRRGTGWGSGSNGPGGGGGPGGSRGPRRMGTMKEIQDCSMPGGG